MSEEPATVRSDYGGLKVIASISLLFGLISLPLAFMFIPGVVAVVFGYKARRTLAKYPDGRPYFRIALVGIILGLVSFVAGIAMDVSASTAAIRMARKAAALSVMASLESSVNIFYMEYGSMPAVEDRIATDSDAGVNLLRVLSGWEKRSPESRNPRNIKFLSLKAGKDRKNGLILDDKDISEGLFDPYGNAYTVFLKRENEKTLRFEFAGKTVELEERRAAAVSPGKDGELETEDDIKSW